MKERRFTHLRPQTGFVRRKPLFEARPLPWPFRMRNPYRYFKTSPAIVQRAVMMYVRHLFSPRQVDDLRRERGTDVSYEADRFWWNRFGSMVAKKLRQRQQRLHQESDDWRWHLDDESWPCWAFDPSKPCRNSQPSSPPSPTTSTLKDTSTNAQISKPIVTRRSVPGVRFLLPHRPDFDAIGDGFGLV